MKKMFLIFLCVIGEILWSLSVHAAEPWEVEELPAFMRVSFVELFDYSDEDLLKFCDDLREHHQVQEYFIRRVKRYQESPLHWLGIFAGHVENKSISLGKIPVKDLFPPAIVSEIVDFMEQEVFRKLESYKDKVEQAQNLNTFELGKEVDLKPYCPANNTIMIVTNSISSFAALKLLSPELIKRYLEFMKKIMEKQNQMISEGEVPREKYYWIDSQLEKLIPSEIGGHDCEIVAELAKHCELPAETIDLLLAFLKENYSLEENASLGELNGTSPTIFTPQDCVSRLNHKRLYYVLQTLGNCGEKAKKAIPYLEYMIRNEFEYSEMAAFALYGIQPANPLAVSPPPIPQIEYSIDYGGFNQ